MLKISDAGKAWIGLAAFVVAYDTWAIRTRRETLSMAFTRAISHPMKRWPTLVGSTVLYTHLVLPRKYHKYDPVRIVAGKLVKLDV